MDDHQGSGESDRLEKRYLPGGIGKLKMQQYIFNDCSITLPDGSVVGPPVILYAPYEAEDPPETPENPPEKPEK